MPSPRWEAPEYRQTGDAPDAGKTHRKVLETPEMAAGCQHRLNPGRLLPGWRVSRLHPVLTPGARAVAGVHRERFRSGIRLARRPPRQRDRRSTPRRAAENAPQPSSPRPGMLSRPRRRPPEASPSPRRRPPEARRHRVTEDEDGDGRLGGRDVVELTDGGAGTEHRTPRCRHCEDTSDRCGSDVLRVVGVPIVC